MLSVLLRMCAHIFMCTGKNLIIWLLSAVVICTWGDYYLLSSWNPLFPWLQDTSSPASLPSCPFLDTDVPLVLFTVLFSLLNFELGGDEFTHVTSLLSYGSAWLQLYPLLRPLPGCQNLISNDLVDIRARDWEVNRGPFLLMVVCSDCIF